MKECVGGLFAYSVQYVAGAKLRDAGWSSLTPQDFRVQMLFVPSHKVLVVFLSEGQVSSSQAELMI